MYRRHSTSFDAATWFEASSLAFDLLCNRYVLQGVHGPMDAYTCIKLREQTLPYVDTGKGVPTDVFILSTGAPTTRAATRIGGLPYWKKGRPWPIDSTGTPLPFLAQFNFSESRDIVSGTNDILLIFAHANPNRGCVCCWESLSDSASLVSETEVAVPAEVPMFWGTRWRTENYPDWRFISIDQESSGIIQLADGTYFYDCDLVYEILGMQISSSGYIRGLDLPQSAGDRIICSLSGIAVVKNRPYPFLNEPDPVDEASSEKWLVPLSNIEDADGFGVIVVVQDKSGKSRCILRNL